MNDNEMSLSLLEAAYKCKPADLKVLLEKIEAAIRNGDSSDKVLFRAKTVVTSKLACHNK